MQRELDIKYMKEAEKIAATSTCIRENRKVGSIAVLNDKIIVTGYNGTPDGVYSCIKRNYCPRIKRNVPKGNSLEISYCLHSEQALVCNAAKAGIAMQGSTVYCTHQPCAICFKILINAGVIRIVYKHEYYDEISEKIAKEIGYDIVKLTM